MKEEREKDHKKNRGKVLAKKLRKNDWVNFCGRTERTGDWESEAIKKRCVLICKYYTIWVPHLSLFTIKILKTIREKRLNGQKVALYKGSFGSVSEMAIFSIVPEIF